MLYLLPTVCFSGLKHGITNVLRFERIAERGARGLPALNALEKVGHLVNEAVLVTDLQTRYPPLVHVRVVSVGNVKRSPPAHSAFIAVIKILQTVEIVKVPENRGVLAIDFESVKGLMAARVTGRF